MNQTVFDSGHRHSYDIHGQIRELQLDLAQSMCDIRDSWLSSNPYEKSNQWGSLYGELDAPELVDRHTSNEFSRFTLANHSNGKLAGYTRYSLPSSDGERGELILIVIDCNLRRYSQEDQSDSVASLLMERTLADIQTAGAGSVIADICSAPVQNEASVRLLVRHGFEVVGSGGTIERDFPNIGSTTIEFARYEKQLANHG